MSIPDAWVLERCMHINLICGSATLNAATSTYPNSVSSATGALSTGHEAGTNENVDSE